jgi:CRP-like cAMP-binding protein
MAVDVAMLQTIPLFGDLTKTQLEKIANLCSEKSISCGETFFKEGEHGNTFFVVPRGEIEVLLTVGKDALACLKWVGVGEILGIQALAPPYRYSSTGRSVTEGTLLAIDAVKLDQLFQQDSQLAFSFLTSLMGAALNRIDGLRSMI